MKQKSFKTSKYCIILIKIYELFEYFLDMTVLKKKCIQGNKNSNIKNRYKSLILALKARGVRILLLYKHTYYIKIELN